MMKVEDQANGAVFVEAQDTGSRCAKPSLTLEIQQSNAKPCKYMTRLSMVCNFVCRARMIRSGMMLSLSHHHLHQYRWLR